jgi:HlyD family secretion protein
MLKKIVIGIITAAIVFTVAFFIITGSSGSGNGTRAIKVEKGSIVDKALAVGRIEPRQEISVKSKIPGIVRELYVEIGQQVRVGDPLMDISPDPTPIEFAEAKRQVEIYQVAFSNAEREHNRARSLLEKELISTQEFESKKASYDEANLRLKLAREKLALIESGKTKIADKTVDNTIKSPINGMVLSRLVEEGDPVVPLTTYQDDLIFKGTVDEIDVGKLKVGMPAEIKIGALPGKIIKGELSNISPKAHKEEGSTLFDLEIQLTDPGDVYLRAGYSANADIIIRRKADIIMVPERLVEITDSASYVEVLDTLSNDTAKREIKAGLSDGINIEITEGLEEGEMLVERPPKEIE